MAAVPYIDYTTLEEFYTINEVCKLFDMEKSVLRQKCRQYGVEPRRNEIGEYGLVKYDVRKLHNLLYHESKGRDSWEDDPWA